MFKIEIPRRKRFCHHCEAPFESGTAYISFLIDKERQDWCAACFSSCEEHPSPIFWKGKCPLKEIKEAVSELEGGLTLFQKFYAEDHPLCYPLAHYLVRLKVFAYRKQLVKEGETYELFEDPNGETFALLKQKLDPKQAEAMQQQLRDALAAVDE
ncbi:MAG: hypothetical protein KDK65_06880 [Chlamydiia bacterium]|nr:hypothetical protein [Chlamydiia bacterium]